MASHNMYSVSLRNAIQIYSGVTQNVKVLNNEIYAHRIQELIFPTFIYNFYR